MLLAMLQIHLQTFVFISCSNLKEIKSVHHMADFVSRKPMFH
jgi:hypothetical protein